jgi:hypothetical protein
VYDQEKIVRLLCLTKERNPSFAVELDYPPSSQKRINISNEVRPSFFGFRVSFRVEQLAETFLDLEQRIRTVVSRKSRKERRFYLPDDGSRIVGNCRSLAQLLGTRLMLLVDEMLLLLRLVKYRNSLKLN